MTLKTLFAAGCAAAVALSGATAASAQAPAPAQTTAPTVSHAAAIPGMCVVSVEGAIGGNALRHFVMTVDYPGAAAYFRCIEGCKPIRPQPAP